MASMTNSPDKASSEAPSTEERLAYLRWSSDSLLALLEAQYQRREHTRSLATALLVALPATVGLLSDGRPEPRADSMLEFLWWVGLGAIVAAWALWYRTVRSGRFPTMNIDAFVADRGAPRESDLVFRTRRVRDCLLAAVEGSSRASDELAEWRGRALRATMLGIGALGTLELLR